GIAVSGDGDDVFTAAPATVTGIPAGWTLYDGSTALSAPGGTATFSASDLGALRITAPDQGGETAVLTLTVTSREGPSGPSATGTETLTVTAFGVAKAPTFGGPTSLSGGASVTLSGLTATGDDADT